MSTISYRVNRNGYQLAILIDPMLLLAQKTLAKNETFSNTFIDSLNQSTEKKIERQIVSLPKNINLYEILKNKIIPKSQDR